MPDRYDNFAFSLGRGRRPRLGRVGRRRASPASALGVGPRVGATSSCRGAGMRAVQYRSVGSEPEVVEIPTPEPGPGQVRLKVTAAGLCHSDEFVMSLPESIYELPLTLGHE